MIKTSIEVRATEGGPVHTVQCWECEGQGFLTFRGHQSECPTCQTMKVVDLTDCDCSLCVQIAEDLEAHGHA